jgi:hypothetical protein
MARLADMFLITVFFVLKFPPGPAAAAAWSIPRGDSCSSYS